jgi:hypothetical protein
VLVGDVICFTIFSENSSRKKRGFQIYYTNLPIFTIKSLPLYIACHDSLDPLFQNLRISIQGSEAAGHVSSATYFSNLLEHKDRRLKIEIDPQPDSTSQPKARGLLHMDCEFNRTPYKKDLITI